MAQILKPVQEVVGTAAYYAQEGFEIAHEGCRMARKGFDVTCKIAEEGYEIARETYNVAAKGLGIGCTVVREGYGIAKEGCKIGYTVAAAGYSIAEESYRIATDEKVRTQKVAEWTTSAKELAKTCYVDACGVGAVGTATAVTVVALPHIIQFTLLNSLLAFLATSGVANIVGNDKMLLAAQLAVKNAFNAGQAFGAWSLDKAAELTSADEEEIFAPAFHQEKEEVVQDDEPQLKIWGEDRQIQDTL
jgi:hypothetical protein